MAQCEKHLQGACPQPLTFSEHRPGRDASCFSRCFGEDVCISIPDVDAYVMVLQAVEPQITLRGTERFWRPAAQLESTKGVILFPDIRILSTLAKAETPEDRKSTGASTSPPGG